MQAWSERVVLRHAAARPLCVRLREPLGRDELAVAGVDTAAAVAWLSALLEGAPCTAAGLSPSDRDALLAAQHRALWGDRILASITCAACDLPFDLSFRLSALERQLDAQRGALPGADGGSPHARTLRDDATGRLWYLSGADAEESAAQRGPAAGRALLAALARGEVAADDADAATPALPEEVVAAAAARLEAIAPLLDLDLDATCPECGQAQSVRFDIQSWVLQRLLDERPQLLADLHALAAGYGWSFTEIAALPRRLRRALADRLAGSHIGHWA